MTEPVSRPRRTGAVLGAAGIAAALIAGSVFLLARGGSFAELVALTREAEEAGVWRTYFTAEDCLIRAVTEDPDSVEGSIDRLEEQTRFLADHVEHSLAAFDGFGTRPWQRGLRDARQAIVDHYLAWEEHLALAGPVLAGITSEPSSISGGITAWLDLARAAIEPISSTFENAGLAFEAAASTDADVELLESLFVPADVTCTATAV